MLVMLFKAKEEIYAHAQCWSEKRKCCALKLYVYKAIFSFNTLKRTQKFLLVLPILTCTQYETTTQVSKGV